MAMGASMASGAMESLVSAINTGDFSLSNLLSTLTSLGMAFPTMVSGMQTVIETFQGINAARKNAANVAVAADAKEIASSKAKIAINSTEATTEVAKQIAKNWAVGLAVAAIVLPMIGGGIVGLVQSNSQKEEEQSSQKNEAFTETQEKASSNEELLKNYRQLKYQYDQTGEGADKLAQASQELASAYGEEGSALLKLSGDYE
jgi:hypothetical protein